jgi:hypothetical protein
MVLPDKRGGVRVSYLLPGGTSHSLSLPSSHLPIKFQTYVAVLRRYALVNRIMIKLVKYEVYVDGPPYSTTIYVSLIL